ncbi:uncharacterized protein LOC131620924 [Vicia villosa]|uniref:uncharacterized protein LOC131620924 n=1 Tax=Vicia villosa TaxID=3911 RepID=UPI00273AFAD1|nr:uncharacterized protein LOC131620924 [Vicia villosa]
MGESSEHRRSGKKKVVCYECKEPGHYKNKCPRLQREKPRKKFEKKKGMMATWDESDSSDQDSDSEDEQANIALMATVDAKKESTSDSDSDEVFSELTREDLVSSLSELLEVKSKLSLKHKKLKEIFPSETKRFEIENSELKEKVLKLTKDVETLKTSSCSDTSIPSTNNILKEYDLSFKKFLSRGIARSLLASMIYGVNGNKRKGIGFEGEIPYKLEPVNEMIIKYKPLYEKFKYGHSHDIKHTSHSKSFHITHTKKHAVAHSGKSYVKSQFNQNMRRTNPKGPKRMWVPKDKIIPVADLLHSTKDKHVMVPGLWVLTSHDGKKVYIPKSGT